MACPSIADRDRLLVGIGLTLGHKGLLLVVLLRRRALHRNLNYLDGLLLRPEGLSRDLFGPTVPAKLHVVLKARVASGAKRDMYHRRTTR